MSINHRQKKSRRYLLQGVGLLLLGSALLLACKLNPSQWVESVLIFTGGGTILLANGFMLYGLLYHADSRSYAEDKE